MSRITCKLKNFENENVKIIFKSEGTVDEYIETIEKWIEKNKWFAKSKEDSLNPEELEVSINKLFDALYDSTELYSNANLKEAIKQVKQDLLSNIDELLSNTSESDEAVSESPKLSEGDSTNSVDKIKETLKENLKEFFGGDNLIKLDFFEFFDRNIFQMSIVYIGENEEDSKIIRDNESITEGMMSFLNKRYKALYNYLKDNNVPLDKISPNMFIMSTESDNYGKINPSYNTLLERFMEYIRKFDDIKNLIGKDFNNKFERKKFPLLEAVYSYLSILYFDDLLVLNYGKYFYVNKKLDSPIEYNEDGTKKYKYNINRKTSLLISGYETNTVRDGLKEQGVFSTKVMELIPIVDSIGYLSKTDVITSLLKLQYVAEHYKGRNESLKKLKIALMKSDFNLVEGWKEAMEITHRLIKNNYIKTLQSESQEGNKITSVDIDNFESIYQYFFNKKNGIYYISRYDTMNKGISRNYDIISSVFGGVKSTVLADYMEVIYDKESGRYITRMKAKSNTYNEVLALFRKINDEVIDTNEDIQEFIIKSNGNVKYGKFEIEYEEEGLRYGIFSLTSKIKSISGIGENTTLDLYFRALLDKLTSVGSIEKLQNSKEEKDKEFINLLEFIDRNLTTDFHTDVLGYLTLRTLVNLIEGNLVLLKLFLSALRVAAARSINIKLKTKISDEPNTEYIKKNLDLFPNYGFLLDIESNQFKEYEGESYLIGAYNDKNSIYDDIVKALKIIRRMDSDSVTKNFEGNNVPNVSVYFTNIIHDFYNLGLNEDEDNDSNITSRLLFSGIKADSIISTWIDTDIETKYGETKNVNLFTTSELFYHNFIDKYINVLSDGIFIAQPVTYSDKKKFLNYVIQLSKIYGSKLNLFQIPINTQINLMMETLGNYYKDLFKKVCNDYRIMFNILGTDNQVFFKANQLMKNYSVSKLVSLASSKNIKLYKDLHYRELYKNGCSTNEILCYYNNEIFANKSNLYEFLQEELANYVNLLLNAYTMIPSSTELSKAFKKAGVLENMWVKDKYMIFARRGGIPVSFSEKITKEDILSKRVEINPLIVLHFYLSNVINNNIKLGLVGHELHHKIKLLKDITGSGYNLVELQEQIQSKKEELQDILGDEKNLGRSNEEIKKLQDELSVLSKEVKEKVYKLIALAHNALFKRTVAIPGTIRPYSLGKLDGILPVYNVAYIEDVRAFVNDYKGNYGFEDDDDIDAHDGSAWITAFTSILENNSLDDSEVGDIKKPLWDIDSPEYGARGLVKYAVNTITNRIMLNSTRSALSMRKIFKKMTDRIKWNKKINLVKDWAIVSYDETAFSKYIINDENNLYYQVGSEYRQIINFGQDPETGIYYTEERKVGESGDPLSKDIEKVYHLFDAKSNHYRCKEIPLNWKELGLDTIDSLYQLHSALGGIYSCSLMDGKLSYSESSNKAVTLFMIYVSKPTEDLLRRLENSKEDLIATNNSKDVMASATQLDFILPLKSALIDCLINDSASKNGTCNINSRSRYYDDEDLEYVSVSTLKYGIQQDSDHEADEAVVTEMSQVISALDATGLYHDEVYDVYRAIGEQTLNSLEIELKALKELKDTKNKNSLYDFVGKVVINNTRDRKGMLKAIFDKLEETFNLTTDHKFDRTLCPFSDATVYNKIILTVASVINKKGIKRKYSGSGMVMAPGYNIYQIWEVDGYPVQYEDLLKLALKYNNTKRNPILYTGNLEKFNEDVVKLYLEYKFPDTVEYEFGLGTKLDEETLSNIDPESNLIIAYLKGDGSTGLIELSLNTIRNYFEFELNTVDFIRNLLIKEKLIKEEENVIITKIIKDNSKPRNLAPFRMSFIYETEEGKLKKLNIFDSKIYKELYKAIKHKKESYNMNNIELYNYYATIEKKWRSRIKLFLKNLEENIYTEWDEEDNEITFKVLSKQEKKAETIMSNMFKSNFNIDAGDSLYDILLEGPKYFEKKGIRPLDGEAYNFDILLITENSENNVYISLDKDPSSKDRRVYWPTTNKNKERIPEEERGDSKVLNRIWLVGNDYRKIVEIGREIDVTDEIEFDSSKRKFIDKVTRKEIPTKNKNNPDGRVLHIDGDKIVEYFEFLTEYSIKEGGKNYSKYCINKDNLKLVLLNNSDLDEDLLLDKEISEIVNSLYKSNSFLMILPSYNIKKTNYYQVRNIFKHLGDREEYLETDFGDYCKNIVKNVMSFAQSIKEGSKDYIHLNVGKSRIFTKEILSKYGINSELKTFKRVLNELMIFSRTTKDEELKKEVNELIEKYNKTKLEYWNRNFVKKHSVKKFNSFLKSLEFISSRIPAQTLLSFMAMRCVGFTGLNTNYCVVSHFQTFLLGSDYDIDKSYMMGYSFDGNGLYLGWSDLFDYSSIEALTASENLPMPKGVKYIIDPKAEIDVTNEANKVNSTTGADRILAIAELLKKIYRHPKFDLNSKIIRIKIGLINKNEKIESLLLKHESTKIPVSIKDEVLKNFISSHILQISSALGNLDESYTPVEIKALKNPASKTEKYRLALSLTLFNPATISIMQNQNMVGKAVTGIAANGQKALFMWRTHSLEVLNNKPEDIDMIRFNIVLDGIKGRYNDEYKRVEIHFLPDLKTDNEFYKTAKEKLSPKISSDNIGSQYISAATDNAKELILACINAGNKMAKCHLYLMALGFDVEDIVKFMTSDAVSFIDKITESNIFIGYNLDINYAIEWAIKYMKNPNPDFKMERVSPILMKGFISKLNSVIKSKNSNEFLHDLETLQKVIKGANEFSTFGRLLGINLGIPQTKEDLMSWKNNIKNAILKAEEKLYNENKKKGFSKEKMELFGVTNKYKQVFGENFDVDRWLDDKEYRKLTSEYYNHIKESLNIFYFLDNIPHFKQMYEGLNVLNSVDRNISIKGQLINEYSSKLRKEFPYAPDNYEKRMGVIFNELFIELFIKGLDFYINIEEDWNILDNSFKEVAAKKKILRLKRDSDIASYKYVFEKYIIPKLKNGTLLSKDLSEEMFNNPNVTEFLNGLVTTNDRGIPLYMANINLTLKDIDPNTRLKYQKYLKGLKELSKYKYGNHNISDLFIMYNLIVNKNLYGNERLTELFEDFITDFENKEFDSYMMRYLRFLGKEDYNESILEKIRNTVLLKDILIRLARLVSRDSIGRVKRSDPYVKVFDPKVGYIYFKNTKYSDYEEIPRLLNKKSGELDKEYVNRQRNLFKYGFGLLYAAYITNIIDDLNSSNDEQVEYTFDDIINIQNLVKYKVKCDE